MRHPHPIKDTEHGCEDSLVPHHPDGPYPWEAEGRWKTDFQHLKQIAVTADRLGYYGSLLGSSPNESLAVSAALIDATERLRFLVAQHPGELSPAVLAKWALTFDQFSNGRLLFNVVNGNDASLATYGIHYGHDERYDFSLEYWRAFQSIYAGETGGYDGRYVKLAPRQAAAASHPLGGWHPPKQKPGIPLWGAGTSPGRGPFGAVAGRLPELRQHPAQAGREVRQGGGRGGEDRPRADLRHAPAGDRPRDRGGSLGPRREAPAAHLHRDRTQRHPAPVATGRDPGELRQRRPADPAQPGGHPRRAPAQGPRPGDLPQRVVGPSLFGFNILGPAAGTYLVGSAERVAERIREYERHGTSAFILSGFPLIDEAQRVADLLFPLLDLDHGFEVPQLGVTARAPKAALA